MVAFDQTGSFNPGYQVVGIILAIVSGCLIGSSFVFKKKGLLRAQAGGEAGEGVAYLKSVRDATRSFSRRSPLYIAIMVVGNV